MGVSLAGEVDDLALVKDSCDLDCKAEALRGMSRLCLLVPIAVPGRK